MKQRLTKTLNRIEFLKQRLESFEDKLNYSLQKEKKLKRDLYLNAGAIETFSILVEKMSEISVNGLVKLINRALPFVFYDRNMKLVYEISTGRGSTKQVEFFILEEQDGITVKASVQESMGDGIRSFVGLMMLMFYLKVSGGVRLVVLDEAISSIADTYLPSFFEFLRNAAEEGKFVFILIAHDTERIEPYMDSHYLMNRGTLQVLKE